MTVADVDGVTISGLLFDAGEPAIAGRSSKSALPTAMWTTLQIPHHSTTSSSATAAPPSAKSSPISSSTATTSSSTTPGSGAPTTAHGVGWTLNTSDNGLIVNGNDVTAYGLFVEHHQKFQVVWNGERGRTYFYQSEIPYDPPDQGSS